MIKRIINMDVAFLNMDNINLKVNTQGVFFFVPPKDMIFFVAYIIMIILNSIVNYNFFLLAFFL